MNARLKFNPKRKFKTHKGLLKRIVITKGGVKVRRIGINKYATKRSNRNNSNRRSRTIFLNGWRKQLKLMLGPLLKGVNLK